jgi:hypothetical protein
MYQATKQQNAKTGSARYALLFAFSDSLLTFALRDRSVRSSLFSDLTSSTTRTSIIRGGKTPS